MAFHDLEQVVPGIPEKEMFMADRIPEDFRRIRTLTCQECMGGFNIGGFDPGGHDPEIAQHGFKADVRRLPGGKLPDLKTTTPADVQGQYGVAAMYHVSRVSGHISGFSGFFEDGDIHTEVTTIPVKGFLGIADADADLLNTGDGGVLFLGHVS